MGLPPQAFQIIEQGMSFGENFPAYAQFLQGPNGSIWVQHLVVPSSLSDEEIEDFNPQLGMGSPDWDGFDGRGRFETQWHDMHRPCGLCMETGPDPLCYIGELGPGMPVNMAVPNIG